MSAPASAAPASPPGELAVSVAQLRITQRIAQAAIRRVARLEDHLEGREPRRAGATAGGAVSLSAAQLLITRRIAQAAIQRLGRVERRLGLRAGPGAAGGRARGPLTLSAAQLLITQRIAQAAIRRLGPAERAAGIGPPPAGSGAARLAWRGDFRTGDLSQWRTRAGGPGAQRVSLDRIQVVRSPRDRGAHAARFEVRRGDRWRGSSGNRAELMHWSGAKGEGQVREYAWSTMFAPGYPRSTVGWQIVTQWHAAAFGTQPPLYVFAHGDTIGLKSVESDQAGRPSPSVVHWRAPMARGRWHRLRLRVGWSEHRERGFIEMWHNGRRVVARTALRTRVPGREHYLKLGLYRSERAAATGVVYHADMRVSRIG